MTFCFTSGPACGGTNFLSGTLQLTTVQQLPGSTLGTFNYNSSANLTGLTGSLSGSWTAQGIVVLNLTFGSKVNLESLLSQNSTHKITGVKIGSGTVDPTPEPGSMVLFGTGLLALGGVLRRKLLA